LPGQRFFAQQVGRLRKGVGPAGAASQNEAVALVDQLQARQFRFSPGVAHDHRQPQSQQLLHEHRIRKLRFEFAQLAAMAQHQQAEPVQFLQRKPGCVRVINNVGAVLVVVVVGDVTADLMALGRSVQLALRARELFWRALMRHAQKLAGDAADALGLRQVHREFPRQPLHRA